MTARNDVVEAFERWSPVAFVVGGVGILGTPVVGSLQVAALVQPPPWLVMGPLLFGLWFVFIGLLGFYRHVAEPAPRLSVGGLVTSGTGWVALSVGLTAAVVIDLTSQRTFVEPGGWAPPLLAGAFVLALLSFLLLGSAAVQSANASRTVGFLLLVPVAAFFGQALLLITKIVEGSVNGALQLALGGTIAITLIVLGYLLWSESERAGSPESRADVTA